MRLGHQAAQVQAQPHAACAALAGCVQPEKRLAQLRQLVCRYAGAVVAHLHFQSVSCAAQADVNRPMAVALDVVQQVAQQQLDVGTVKL